jgi:phosphoserine phosphatase RsbX
VRVAAGWTIRPRSGENVSGDAVVARLDGDRAILAVVDALGHGPSAAETAALAVAHLEAVAFDADIRSIVEGLHLALRGSRGAAAMVCRFDADRIAGCGVGNVELRSAGASVSSVLSPGVLGLQVRKFQTFEGVAARGARFVLFSDGLSSHLAAGDFRTLGSAGASEALLGKYGRDYDDAAVLVADVEV